MRNTLVVSTMFAVAVCFTLGALAADKADEDKPKFTVKQVMQKAHKGKDALKNKVQAGNASAEEKKMLLGMYQALAKNEPPKGDKESWKEKTTALVKAAQGVVDDKEGAVNDLKKAANCGACHKVHKPS